MTPPADAEQPGAGGSHLRRPSCLREAASGRPPTVEPARRARPVQMNRRTPASSELGPVAAGIEEDVRERSANLARCSQQPVVVAPVEHRPAALADSIHGARQASRDALHAARERFLALRFHDQMSVVALERVVRHAEAAPLARVGQRAPPLVDQRPTPQRGNALPHTQRHVDRAVPRDLLASSMPNPGPRPPGPPRARPRATSSRPHPVVGERELLRPARHGNRIWRSSGFVKSQDHGDTGAHQRRGAQRLGACIKIPGLTSRPAKIFRRQGLMGLRTGRGALRPSDWRPRRSVRLTHRGPATTSDLIALARQRRPPGSRRWLRASAPARRRRSRSRRSRRARASRRPGG